MKVRAFGIKTAGGNVAGTVVGETENEVRLMELKPTLAFVDAGLIVFPSVAGFSGKSTEQRSATEALVRNILQECRKGRLVCVYYNNANEPGHAEHIGGRLLQRWSIAAKDEQVSLEQVNAPEFEDYIGRFGMPGYVFGGADTWPQAYHVLASSKSQLPSAFAVPEGKGLIYFLPANIVAGSEAQVIQALRDAIAAHSDRIFRPTTAPIASSFEFAREESVRTDRQTKQDELDNLDEQLRGYMEKKDILYLRNEQLEDRLVEWFPEYLKIQTSRRPETNIEDFWLQNDKGEEAAIVEAKALTQNVKRDHIGAIALHRDQRNLKPTFPALLIANAFAEANTVKQKSRPGVGLNECRHAVRRDVLVVRTLDLVQLLDQLERKVISQKEVWRLLTKQTGWLKVEGDTQEVITG